MEYLVENIKKEGLKKERRDEKSKLRVNQRKWNERMKELNFE